MTPAENLGDALGIRIYDKLVGVETLLSTQGQSLQRVEQGLADHEDRLRKIEPDSASSASHALRLADHEERLRGGERWRYGLPVTALLSLLALIEGWFNLSHK